MPTSVDSRSAPHHRSPEPRRRRRGLLLAVALVAVVVLAVGATIVVRGMPGAPPAPPGSTGVRTTDQLVESMGVAVQLQYNADRYESDLRPALAELGLRHVRVGGQGEPFFDKVRDLHDSFGIRSMLVMDPRDEYTGTNVPDRGIVPVLDAVSGIEGPNEWDINEDLRYEDQGWPEAVRAFQQQMHDAVKNFTNPDPAVQEAVRKLPVLTPTVARPSEAQELGAVPCDAAAIHSYPGGNVPDEDLDSVWLPQAAVLCPGGEVYSTESGYCNELSPEGCTEQGGVSERASAKYALRHYLEYFTRGVERDYLYNLSTDEWDLFLRGDGTRKPAFDAVRSFIDLLEEPGTSFEPESLDIGISETPDLHHQLLQRSDGTHVLALWLNVESYPAGQECCDEETERAVTLQLPSELDATVYLPTFEGTEPVQVVEDTRTLELSVPDHVMLVELR